MKYADATQLRVYTFTHCYLSSIQQGIQSGHAAMELVNQHVIGYTNHAPSSKQAVLDWVRYGKTIICLNGGNTASLRSVRHELRKYASTPVGIPCASFNEDDDSMQQLLTGVAIVVPEEVWGLDVEPGLHDAIDQTLPIRETYTNETLKSYLNSFSLAR